MFWWQGTVRGSGGTVVDIAFTDRHGGSSQGELDSLNLGGLVGDDPDVVQANRAAVESAFDIPPGQLSFMRQVHGKRVASVRSDSTDPDTGSDRIERDTEQCDAQVTDIPGVGLAVLVADCTPVLLVDTEAGVIAAAHAGRPGMLAGVVDATLDEMARRGATAPQAFVGPSVCGRCYEVPLQMREDAAKIRPESRAVSWTGTPAIDVAAGVVAQLHARAVPVTWIPGCTRESEGLFSYRRSHGEGRFAGVVVMRKEHADDD